ncbi:CaiB/BaiF CoA-transferase family protein [Actinomycetospora sp. NBRC 106378]|uniref:CaiB/BaiF CoA transferase family protein n=1 Tax=Actinomycetospora sp. NBRC 106378 TaxID=3032208 RepID=UPI0024A533AC|nr:CaiB/BaiF CoA-transferase family protein [Actinomycetospora sp. NBRC 106378]GLZ55121.1 putative L-carnitine dehydratase [Actinomycetospora sp. NBRC 106378]
MTGPLAGLRVLEMGTIIAGPFAARILGDYGADVVKIEPPGRPDPLRDWGQGEYKGEHFMWTVIGRNKRCITLDPRSGRGQEIFLELVEQTDVIVENFRPGTLERWGLGFDRLSEVNPGLILGRVSGYGQTGPYASKPGYASVAEAVSGMRSINGFPGEAPPRMAVSLGDSLAGMVAVQGVLAALYSRSVTGKGQVVDIAITEACLSVLESSIPEYDKLGAVRRPGGTKLDGIAPSNIYRSSDGLWMVVAANQDTVFKRLCEAMGRPELAIDERFVDHVARGRNQDEIDGIVGDWVASRTADEVREILDGAGVIVGPVNTIAEVVTDEQFLARDMIVPHHDERLDEDVLGPGVVPTFAGTPASVRRAGPALGADNQEVYRELGLSDAEIEELTAAGTI